MVRNIVCNPTTWEVEAGGVTLKGHLGLHSMFQATLGYIMILNLKKKKKGRSREVQKERKETTLISNITTINFNMQLLIFLESNTFSSFSSCEE